MIVVAREVFVCKCATAVGQAQGGEPESEFAARVVFSQGTAADLARLDPAFHDDAHKAELGARLERGEHWMIGSVDDAIVTYTWLHTRRTATYPYLPGCTFALAGDVGYGYDAWTPPALRGHGLRRKGFVEELGVLARAGMAWEASFFVKHQLEGATRSLASAGIEIVPLYRVSLRKDRSLTVERLRDDEAARPAFSSA